MATIKYPNEYCFVAYYTFHVLLKLLTGFFQTIHGLYSLFLLIHYIRNGEMQLNDVIKSIGWYWALAVLPIQTDIAKNSTDTDTSIGISASLVAIGCSL